MVSRTNGIFRKMTTCRRSKIFGSTARDVKGRKIKARIICFFLAYLHSSVRSSAKRQDDEIGHQEDHHELLHELGTWVEDSVELFVERSGQESAGEETASGQRGWEGDSLGLENVLDDHVGKDEKGGGQDGLGEGFRGDALEEVAAASVVGSRCLSGGRGGRNFRVAEDWVSCGLLLGLLGSSPRQKWIFGDTELMLSLCRRCHKRTTTGVGKCFRARDGKKSDECRDECCLHDE